MWDILSAVGDVQYRGECHDKCGGYLEYCEDVQYHGANHEYHGGYLESCGDTQYYGGMFGIS